MFVFAAIAVVGGLLVLPKMPKDQNVHVVLGNGAPRVTELQIRYFGPLPEPSTPPELAGYFAREATFRYGQDVRPPRIVDHTPRLVDGDYLVEIAVATGQGSNTVSRRVKLSSDHATSIDVAEAAR